MIGETTGSRVNAMRSLVVFLLERHASGFRFRVGAFLFCASVSGPLHLDYFLVGFVFANELVMFGDVSVGHLFGENRVDLGAEFASLRKELVHGFSRWWVAGTRNERTPIRFQYRRIFARF